RGAATQEAEHYTPRGPAFPLGWQAALGQDAPQRRVGPTRVGLEVDHEAPPALPGDKGPVSQALRRLQRVHDGLPALAGNSRQLGELPTRLVGNDLEAPVVIGHPVPPTAAAFFMRKCILPEV